MLATRLRLPLLPIALVSLLGGARAQEPPAPEAAPAWRARLPARVIAGRLIVRCDVSTSERRLPLQLFFDYDRPCGLELHNKAAFALGAERDAAEGAGLPIRLHLEGHDIAVERREHGDEDLLDEFTRLYSRELLETACAGAIGAKILGDYHVTFDLPEGSIWLEPARAETGGAPDEVEGTTTLPITVANNQVWLPVRYAGDRKGAMNLATTRYDTVVDEEICDELDRPAGDIGSVLLKDIDLARCVALRPVDYVQVHADGAIGSLGINLLEGFRVEIDRVNRLARWQATRPARFPAEDLEFFKAMVARDPAALLGVLDAHPKARLAREAAQLLMRLVVDSSAPAEECGRAVEWMDRTRIDDLRATEALSTMKALLEARRPDLALVAGELGVKGGRQDRYPESVHQLHAKLGEILLDKNQDEKAWEHLLSAAFGLPEDGMIHVLLGRFYERQKRWTRAMSRYIQAVIQPESGALAVAGLERVQQAMDGQPLSVDVVDRMIAGKVYGFGAATVFTTDARTDTNRVVLAELFTNVHLGRRLREGWRSFIVGGTMALEGLISHYPRQRLAVLTYHLEEPEPQATMNALGLHMARRLGVQTGTLVVDGHLKGPGAGRDRDGEALYERGRQAVLGELELRAGHDIAIEATTRGDAVAGSVVVRGPARPDLRLQVILAERGVLYPGKGTVVVHRMLARAALTDPIDGVAWQPVDGAMTVKLAASLDAIRRANEAWLDDWEKRTGRSATRLSTKIDPRQVTIVAALRDARGAVLQAAQVDATPEAGK